MIQNLPRIHTATGEEIQGHQAEVGVCVCRTVTLVQHYDRREAWRRISAETVTQLGDHRRTSEFGSAGHCVEESAIVEANVSGDVPTIYKKVLAFVQLMNPRNR
jgi:hypothetical protein